jgi:type II secretory pathway pseudopilin PulG
MREEVWEMEVKRILRKAAGRLRRSFRRGEKGFAIIIVLVALAMLSVLGAASLLLVVSSLEGAVNVKPEDKAFQIAESAVYLAHAKIVNDEVSGETVTESGSLLGGSYQLEIDPVEGTYNYIVTSIGSYQQGGVTYRRGIRETVTYSGLQAFDVIKNYLFYAGNDINLTVDEVINAGAPITINCGSGGDIGGGMRAERDINIIVRPDLSLGDGLTINGDIEAKRKLYVRAAPQWFGGINVRLYGNIKTGDAVAGTDGEVELWVDGQARLFPPAFSWANIYAATTGSINWDLYTGTLTERINQLFGWDLGSIYTGNVIDEPACQRVYVPEPNFEYYRALAQDQGNFFLGDKTLSGNLGDYGTSSVTVIYCTGDLTVNGLTWDQPDMKGILVCEGDFTANSTLQFNKNSQFQVIAGGNATFNNDWSFLGWSSTNEYFFWAGNDVNIDLGMFADQYCQITAQHDINIFSSENLFSMCTVNYRAPDVDVAGFPIDLTVRNWREISPESEL